MKKLFDQVSKDEWELLSMKGDDYATTDRLSNFRRMATYLKTTPAEIALFFIWHKIDRLTNIIKHGISSRNESLQDTISDLRNYCFLLDCCLREEINRKEFLGSSDQLDKYCDRAVDKAWEWNDPKQTK